jgi:hypothetical protein
MAILAIVLAFLAIDPQMPTGYTCEDVRRVVAEQGRVRAFALAVEQGLSIRQIYLIRRTCKV